MWDLFWPKGVMADRDTRILLSRFFCVCHCLSFGAHLCAFASAARSDYMDRVKADGLSERRSIIGAAGAIAIPMVVFAAWVAHGLQSGVWEQPSTRALLGYGAFLVLGVTAAMRIAINRRRQD